MNHPRLDQLSLARVINRMHGGPVITAWEVEQLTDEWIDLYLGIAVDLPRKQERARAIKKLFNEFEAAHPTYGKRH